MDCPTCSTARELRLRHAGVPDFEHGQAHVAVDFYRCEGCAQLVAWPPPDSELAAPYPTDYRAHVAAQGGLLGALKMLQARWILRRLRRFLPPDPEAALLDLGCGAGFFLLALRQAGYVNLWGFDRSPSAEPALAKAGIRFVPGELERLPDFPGSFDCVFLNYVLEHSSDPEGLLAQLRTRLRPGGMVFVLTPNASSLAHAFFGRYWVGLHSPRHLRVYTAQSLADLSRRAGFTAAESEAFVEPSSWALSLQNWIQGRRAPARGTAGYVYALLLLCAPLLLLELVTKKPSGVLAVFH